MKSSRSLYAIMLTLFWSLILSNNIYGNTFPLHAFSDYSSSHMQKMELIGVVASKSLMITGKSRRKMLDYDTREMILNAKLYGETPVRIGDTVFVIKKDPDHLKYQNGLIVGKATVVSVFQTEFQGWMIKAQGNLSMVKNGHFIARLDFGIERQKATEYSKKGDRYYILRDYPNAYTWYKKSLDLDGELPETYIKLSKLMSIQGMEQKAFGYIKQAWKLNTKIEDPNYYLELPGLYLKSIINDISKNVSVKNRFLKFLKVLNDIKKYSTETDWIKPYLSRPVLRMVVQKGLPNAQYQQQYGLLLKEIFQIMHDTHSIRKILSWLTPAERDILFAELKLPYRRSKFESVRKKWDEAFFNASIYHFELAHELNPLDTKAAYQIVTMSFKQLKGAPQKKREVYESYIDHYSREYFRVPDRPARFERIRIISNKFAQR